MNHRQSLATNMRVPANKVILNARVTMFFKNSPSSLSLSPLRSSNNLLFVCQLRLQLIEDRSENEKKEFVFNLNAIERSITSLASNFFFLRCLQKFWLSIIEFKNDLNTKVSLCKWAYR